MLRWPTSALLTATIARPPGRWPWTAFAASCSTAGYVFLYSVRHTAGCAFFAPDPRPVLSTRVCRVQVYYFFVKTKMSGFFQTVFYFGYSAPPPRASLCAPAPRCCDATHARAAATAVSIFCVALGVMCGTLGYCGCSVFVRRIYVNIKSD